MEVKTFRCNSCRGTGKDSSRGKPLTVCPTCDGSGYVQRTNAEMLAEMAHIRAIKESMIKELYKAGAPDRAICRVLTLTQPIVRQWRLLQNLPAHETNVLYWTAHKGRRWEDDHQEVVKAVRNKMRREGVLPIGRDE